MAFFLYFLEIWPLLLWKFGLGSYARLKIHWCLAARFAVQWIKTKRFANFLFTGDRNCQSIVYRPPRCIMPMNHKFSNNFQDQTFTAKVVTPPNFWGEMPFFELFHTSGNSFSSRWWKFWHVFHVLENLCLKFLENLFWGFLLSQGFLKLSPFLNIE